MLSELFGRVLSRREIEICLSGNEAMTSAHVALASRPKNVFSGTDHSGTTCQHLFFSCYGPFSPRNVMTKHGYPAV